MKTALIFKKTKVQLERDKRIKKDIKDGIAELKAISRRLQRRLKVLRNGK